MRIFKPNVQLIHQEAAQIREKMENRGSGGGQNKDIIWYEWRTEGEPDPYTKVLSDGWNYLRALPPYREDGTYRLLRYVWKNLPVTQDNVIDVKRTWPEKGVECHVTSAFSRLKADFPELEEELDFYPKPRAWMNVIDRKNEALGPTLANFPPSVYNWIAMNLSEMITAGINILDTAGGVDFKIKRSPKTDGWYEMKFLGTETANGFTPTPSPLTADPAILAHWMANLWDIDAIFKFPDDATMAKYHGVAQSLISYFTTKAQQLASGSAVVPPPVDLRTPAPGHPPPAEQAPLPIEQPPPPTEQIPPQSVQIGTEQYSVPPPVEEHPPLTSFPPAGTFCSVCGKPQYQSPHGFVCELGHGGAPEGPMPNPIVHQATVPEGVAQAVADTVKQIQPPPQVQQPATPPPPSSPPVTNLPPPPVTPPPVQVATSPQSPSQVVAPTNPTDVPPCYQDHQPGHSKCMMCPKEFECMDTTGKTRVQYDWATDPQGAPITLAGR